VAFATTTMVATERARFWLADSGSGQESETESESESESESGTGAGVTPRATRVVIFHSCCASQEGN